MMQAAKLLAYTAVTMWVWQMPLAAGEAFHAWAATPPMGWNSWDCFATTVTEEQTKAHADSMAEHPNGLRCGIHLMRGTPRQAVAKNLPVKDTAYHAQDIANKASICPWNPDMYGVDMSRPGAQAYYDSVFELIASWGVDYVKGDDISRPYHEHEREIEAIRRAIDRTGRPIVVRRSPGEAALT